MEASNDIEEEGERRKGNVKGFSPRMKLTYPRLARMRISRPLSPLIWPLSSKTSDAFNKGRLSFVNSRFNIHIISFAVSNIGVAVIRTTLMFSASCNMFCMVFAICFFPCSEGIRRLWASSIIIKRLENSSCIRFWYFSFCFAGSVSSLEMRSMIF